MSFLSFHLEFYKNELKKLQTAPASAETVYQAKQLLKMLDDLLDEGYPKLNEKLEDTYSGVTFLKTYLKENHAEPFPIFRKSFFATDVTYTESAYELTKAIDKLIEKAEKSSKVRDDALLLELIDFCEWIGYQEDTAYIFLLRDTLLPYIYYQKKNRKNIYPWLLSRKTLAKLTGTNSVDDEIRSFIFKALESGRCRTEREFCDTTFPGIRSVLKRYPKIEKEITKLLGEIKQNRILVVESGCTGTFPMLLMSLDHRTDLRMYTTYPYLFQLYGNKIFTTKYEKSRLFETLYSQDLYFRFSDFRDGKFYVEKCNQNEIEKISLAEVKTRERELPSRRKD